MHTSVSMTLRRCTLCLLLLGLAGCPKPAGQPYPGTPPTPATPETPPSPETPATPQTPASPDGHAGTAGAPPIKQLILIYTGDTLSALQPINNNDEDSVLLRLGGLSALTGALFDYQQSITAMTRQRVQEQGGDAQWVRADAERGILGEHPYLLLDYGGWERDGDPQGKPYVALQLRMYGDLKYSAVGMKLYQRLPAAEWQSYAGLKLPAALSSAGPNRAEAWPVQRVVKRDIHGASWGVASIPLPPKAAKDQLEQMEAYVEEAAKALAQARVEHCILLCSGGPKALYEKLLTDQRFDVVIGANPPALAAPQGFGKLPAGGPLLLPELNWGGQEFAACHLIYPTDGAEPAEYNFTRHVVQDNLAAPYPYRKQVAAAIKERQAAKAVAAANDPGAARIGAP